MTIDEAKEIIERRREWLRPETQQAVDVLAAAVRDDDLVRLPEGYVHRPGIDCYHGEGISYCLRSDLPVPVRKVVLREYMKWDGDEAVFVWLRIYDPKEVVQPGFFATGNTRTIEIPADTGGE